MRNSAQQNDYQIRQCTNENCSLRFPAPQNSGIGTNCPKCKSLTTVVRNIRLEPDLTESHEHSFPIHNLEIVLDNLRSCFNVGAIFRSADGAGLAKIHLCGICPTPDNNKVHKTALGSENSVPFEIHKNALQFICEEKKRGKRIWALEKTPVSEDLSRFRLTQSDPATILIAGNEVCGIDPDVLEICDARIQIPMAGIKGSLNVAIALGIAVYNIIDFSSY